MNHRGAPRSAKTPTTCSFSSDITSTTVIVACAIGLAARICLIAVSPAHKAPWDHHEYVRWGNQTLSTGVLNIYSSPPPEGDTYLPFKWDCSDLEAVIDSALSQDRWRQVAVRAQAVYGRALFEREGREEFCARFREIVRS